MTDRQTMLEAHVRFELERLQGEHLRSALDEEVAALFDWLGTVKLSAVVKESQIIGWIKREVVAGPVSEEAIDSIRESVHVAFEFLQEDETRVEQIFPRALFDRASASAIGMDRLRHEISRQVVSTTLYSVLISDVLYQGIKGFVLTENSFAKKFPGASSLVKFGQNAMTSAAPQMEKNIDRQLIAYIHDHIQEYIHESERFLDTAVDDQAMANLANELWEANAHSTMSSLMANLDARSLDGIVEIVKDFWLHFRSTTFFLELVTRLVHNFFLRHGKKDVRTLLDEMGVSQEMVVDETHHLAVHFAEQALQSGYLEQRIRSRLAAFYSSYPG